MKLSELYTGNKPVISFEVYPPKTDEGIDKLMGELKKLKVFDPAFISVTYGAGGTTQGRSLIVIKRIMDELGLIPIPHFTCIGSDKESILSFVKVIEGLGLKNILALRGDPPKDKTYYHPEKNVFHYASELVAFLKANTDLEIAVAGYPEVHPQAKSLDEDLTHLNEKIKAGASLIMTQLFFDNAVYFNYVEKAKKLGINVPVIPGILPLTSAHQIQKSIECGAKIPAKLTTWIDPYQHEPLAFHKAGIEYVVQQVKGLLKAKVPGLHLYTFNQAEAVSQVLRGVSL